ncbi:MAG TPA: helix-turn-helix domain-containing protein [Chloroflexota bacterium]|nr:helix-turn-helix domain-containing protein [Chloroflexota bacterium]
MDETLGVPELQVVGEQTLLYALPWPALRRWLVAQPAALDAVLAQSVRLRVRVQQRILELATCSVRVRLAHVLARLGPAGLVSGLSRDVLALMVGASREHVTRALDGLRAEGLVAYPAHGREIVLCDRERLARLEEIPPQSAKV